MDVTRRYARWLAWTSRIALAGLVAAYLAYISGFVPAHVPIARLPELWGLPAAKFLEETRVHAGWGWIEYFANGDMLVLAAIALLICSSIFCLAVIIPIFTKRGEPLFVAICGLQIVVLLVAASGWLSAR